MHPLTPKLNSRYESPESNTGLSLISKWGGCISKMAETVEGHVDSAKITGTNQQVVTTPQRRMR